MIKRQGKDWISHANVIGAYCPPIHYHAPQKERGKPGWQNPHALDQIEHNPLAGQEKRSRSKPLPLGLRSGCPTITKTHGQALLDLETAKGWIPTIGYRRSGHATCAGFSLIDENSLKDRLESLANSLFLESGSSSEEL
jgi:hypothetical protein